MMAVQIGQDSSHPPPLRVLPTVPATIDAEDARDLRWYYRTGGLDVFASSTFGAQLERASLVYCGGQTCRRCKGAGFVASNPRKWRKTTEAERDIQRWLGSKGRYLAKPFGDQVCGRCQGSGWTERRRKASQRRELTARPRFCTRSDKGGSKPIRQGGIEIVDADMLRLGRVESRLRALHELEPGAVLVLAAFYGPDQGGKVFSVWPLTAAAKKLLRTNPHQLVPLVLLSNELAAQKETPTVQRGALLEACESQARALLDGARRGWNVVSARHRARVAALRAVRA